MTDLLDKKLRKFFKHVDVNDDGYVSLSDFIEIGDSNCVDQKVSDVERKKTRECFTKVWRDFMKFTGAGDDGLLTSSILIESVKKQRNDPAFKAGYKALVYQYFHVLDTSGDGFLQREEYERSLMVARIKGTELVKRAFDIADLNHDGKLSYEEYCTALVEYLTSDDEKCPYNELWGPLL